MHISPKQLLQSLLYLTPITLLALASCGGGGGGGSSTPSLTASYTVGGAASGVQATTAASGLVLQLNGGNDLNIASGVKNYKFTTAVVAGTPYSVTVLRHPSSPVQNCMVANPTGSIPNNNVTNANVTCSTAYTIDAAVTGLTGTLVLQDNGGDNLLFSTNTTLPFSTPVLGGSTNNITVLTQPRGQTCTVSGSPVHISAAAGHVTVACVTDALPVTAPPPDRFAYVVNHNNNNNTGTVSSYTIDAASGTLTTQATATAENGPTAIAVDAASTYAYVTNQYSNYSYGTVNVFSIAASGVLTQVDADSSILGNQQSVVTGSNPVALAIHPSGKFAYVVNKLGNSVSAYNIDAGTGALAKIDANGTAVSGTDIATGVTPVAIAIDPAGTHAYVANVGPSGGDGYITAYNIDAYGVLTRTDAKSGSLNIATGVTPSSIAITPDGTHLFVTNAGSGNIYIFDITNGLLAPNAIPSVTVGTGTGPSSIAIHPSSQFAYVTNTITGSVSIFSITSGSLMGGPASLDHPVSISVDSTGQYAYVVNSNNTVSTYSINYDPTVPSGGDLLTFVNSTNTGTNPIAVTTAK